MADITRGEYTQIKWTGNSASPLRHGGLGVLADPPSDSSKTSSDGDARPWAFGVVFYSHGNASDQVIVTQGEGTGATDDKISLELDASGKMTFNWGRGSTLNTYSFGNIQTSAWYGVYVESDGTRLSAASATAANLDDAFRIRYVTLSSGDVVDPSGTWEATGVNMSDQVGGNFTIGGIGASNSFYGKVASTVVTTLLVNETLPTDSEISAMIVDPIQWLDDYKVGNDFRRPNYLFPTAGFTLDGTGQSGASTQVWLMGDGTNDAYSVIRNQVSVNDTGTTCLTMVNMESSDIVSVNIPGLT